MDSADSSTADRFQPFGAVVLLDRGLHVRHATHGCEALLGREATAIIGAPLGSVIDPADADALAAVLASGPDAVGRPRVRAPGGSLKVRAFDAGDDLVGLDLIPVPPDDGGSAAAAVERMSGWSERLLEADSVDALIDIATSVARERTGFDGSWIVRIESEDGTGKVISALVPPTTPTALGTLVQPSDLPPEQRRYRGRQVPYFVADLAAATVELVPSAHGLDLAGSALLHPFPAWLAWLASVGPRATLGIPIVVRGDLWGWILAHHPSALPIPVAVQSELRLLGSATGTRLTELLALEETRERLELSRASVRVMQSVASADDLVASLARVGSAFPEVCEADSAVVAIGGHVEVAGVPLPADVVDQVLGVARAALAGDQPSAVVSSETFGTAVPIDSDLAAGYAAMRLDADAEHVVVWVRGEQRRSVRWAAHAVVGDEPQEELFAGLGERVEEERGACAPWTRAQLHEIAGIREALAEVFVSRYGALQTLTAELARSNEEYDAFAHAAAHDLGAPLRGIRQNLEFFLEDVEGTIDVDEQEPLHTAIRLTGHMRAMLEDLMTYARVGREAWAPRAIETGAAVADAAELLGPKLDGARIDVEPGTFTTDPGALRQVLLNLLGNAAKYSRGPAHIVVGTTTLGEAARSSSPPKTLAPTAPETEVLVVTDHGIGIAPAHHERIFELFRQVDARAEGTGTGLALCRLICRRHGGDIWLSSELDGGTTFYVVAGQ